MYKALVLIAAVLLTSCSRVDVSSYAEETPGLELREYFAGHVKAWGMFQDRSGKVIKRFTVDIHGHVEGDTLTLDEDFLYSDGSTQKRIWTLTAGPAGSWTGTAGDVVGQAEGRVMGNALHWQYVLRLPVDGTEYDVHLDDWMYLIDPETMVNRSFMSKFGVELGQVTLFFRKQR